MEDLRRPHPQSPWNRSDLRRKRRAFRAHRITFNPAEENERCRKCAGDRKDAPVIGLIIMRGMTRHGAEFDGGDILDPEIGTVYRCRLTLSSDGMKLMVRGYIGMSLFGRTQTWIRLADGPVTPAPETAGHSLASVAAEGAK
jgi:uncharacterized protein (DUF2147 family)